MATIIQEILDKDNDKTTIQITKKTRARIDAVGKRHETYDVIINRILDEWEEK